MSLLSYFKSVRSPEVRSAWAIALATDALQIVAMPLFGEGALSPADTVLDLAVGAILIRLLGWHWAFLPTLVAELIPGVDLVPTWTAAVWYVTRNTTTFADEQASPSIRPEMEILPPDPATSGRR